MKFSDHVFVVNLSISVWGAQETDRQTSDEVLVAKRANHKAGRFVKNILGGSCKELEAIQKFALAFRAKMKMITIPQGNSRFVFPIAQTARIMGIIKQGEQDFVNLVNAFLENYNSILGDARVNSGDLLREDQFPTVAQVERKFKFNYRVEPMPEANGFDTAFDLQGFEEDLKHDFEKKMHDMFADNEKVLINRLAKRVALIENSMSTYEGKRGQLGQNIFETTLSEIDIVRSLNIRNSSNIASWCNRLALLCARSAVDYRKDVVERQDAIRQLNTLAREMEVINMEEVFV